MVLAEPFDPALLKRWLALVGFAALPFAAARSAESAVEIRSLPFAAPLPREGSTLFTELSPADTGVVTTNAFSDPAMWGKLYQEFTIGAIGTGIAIGDYDKDGRPDLFIVSKTESCRLFRNLGDWKFAEVTESAGVSDVGDAAAVWKQGASFADVNNDG